MALLFDACDKLLRKAEETQEFQQARSQCNATVITSASNRTAEGRNSGVMLPYRMPL